MAILFGCYGKTLKLEICAVPAGNGDHESTSRERRSSEVPAGKEDCEAPAGKGDHIVHFLALVVILVKRHKRNISIKLF